MTKEALVLDLDIVRNDDVGLASGFNTARIVDTISELSPQIAR